jgi:hypothetical protein
MVHSRILARSGHKGKGPALHEYPEPELTTERSGPSSSSAHALRDQGAMIVSSDSDCHSDDGREFAGLADE